VHLSKFKIAMRPTVKHPNPYPVISIAGFSALRHPHRGLTERLSSGVSWRCTSRVDSVTRS
jgi:hypothetical protein